MFTSPGLLFLKSCFELASLVGSHCSRLNHEGTWVDGDRFSSIFSLVDADQAVRQFKHVVAKADDHKLRILGPLLDVVRHNAHILEVCIEIVLYVPAARKAWQYRKGILGKALL